MIEYCYTSPHDFPVLNDFCLRGPPGLIAGVGMVSMVRILNPETADLNPPCWTLAATR